MRTTKELLIILRKYLLWLFYIEGCDGLCICTSTLFTKGIISFEEMEILDKYLYENKPSGIINNYWWKPGRTLPRFMFLNKLIRKL